MLPIDATMCPSCVLLYHSPSLLRTPQKLAAAPPTVPPSHVFSLCRSSTTDFLPFPALLPPLGVTHLHSEFRCDHFPMICLRKPVYVPSTFLSITDESTQVSEPKSSTAYATALYNIAATLVSNPSLLNSFPNFPQTALDCLIFRLIAGQSSSVWSRGRPRYLKFSNLSTSTPPYTPYMLNLISLHLYAISTSLHLIRIYVTLLRLSSCLYLISPATGTWTPQW